MSAPAPTSLKNDGQHLVIEWSDGVTHRLAWRMLREQCPCATCRTERAKPSAPKPVFNILTAAEARPLAPTSIKPVGNYAYGIAFSDGHNTGIYSLEYLRQLGEQASSR